MFGAMKLNWQNNREFKQARMVMAIHRLSRFCDL